MTSEAKSSKALVASAFVSWITQSRGSQLPCHEDTQAAQYRGPCNEHLPPASTKLTGAQLNHLGSVSSTPVRPSDDYSPSYLDCNFMRHPESEPPSYVDESPLMNP